MKTRRRARRESVKANRERRAAQVSRRTLRRFVPRPVFGYAELLEAMAKICDECREIREGIT